MLVREIMRSGAFTIGDTDCLGNAFTTMTNSAIRHLPVLSGEVLVGMLSERDILEARSRVDDSNWWLVPVRSAMHAPVQSASPDAEVAEVAARMAAGKFGAMPIVESGKIVGIVTSTDLLANTTTKIAKPVTTADVMTPFPFTVRPNKDLADAIRQMIMRRVRHLPVVVEGRLVGMLSEGNVRTAVGDPVRFIAEQGTIRPHVEDAMVRTTESVSREFPIANLVKRFADERLEVLAVSDRAGVVVGIVSYVDLLRAITN